MSEVRVWDLGVRLFHWGLGAAVLVSYLSSEDERWIRVHAVAGIGILALVVARVAWGIFGTSPEARLGRFLRPPREVLAYARAYLRGRPPHHLGHNPLGGAMVAAFGLVLLGLIATGSVVYAGPEWDGPLSPWLSKSVAHGIAEVHEGLQAVLLVLIGAHVLGVLVSSRVEGQNLVKGMITGRKRAPGAEPGAPAGSWVRSAAAILLGGAVGLGTAMFLGLTKAAAAEPAREMLGAFEREARAESPAFAGFRAEAGAALYVAEHTRDGEKVSCATCHTADPTKTGRSPAGKVVEPLAPSANAQRFTDRAHTEKWFGRNCKQVLGRPCTTQEKGDFLTWLLTR